MVKFKQHFGPMETASTKQGVMGENELAHTPRKWRLRNKRDRISAQEVKISSLDNLEVAATPKRRTLTTGQPTKKVPSKNSAFDDILSGKKPPGYTAQSKAIDNASRMRVLTRR